MVTITQTTKKRIAEACPECYASWPELKGALESDDSLIWYPALLHLKSCPVCAEHFKGFTDMLSGKKRR